MPIYQVATLQVGQSSTNPLTLVNELENTIGAISSSRVSAGKYKLTFPAGTITTKKLWISTFGDYQGNDNVYLPIWGGSGAIAGYYTMYPDGITDAIVIEVENAAGSNVDLNTLIDIGTLYLPDIRTYP